MYRSRSVSSNGRRFPAWQREYEAVVTESDVTACFKRLEIAEAAVRTRRASLEKYPDHHAERIALEEALFTLIDIKRNRLNFR